MAGLVWERTYDARDNSVWEAASTAADAGGPFRWRVEPRLRADEVVWCIGGSAGEIVHPGDDDEAFETLEEAKAFCEGWERETIGDSSPDPRVCIRQLHDALCHAVVVGMLCSGTPDERRSALIEWTAGRPFIDAALRAARPWLEEGE